MRFSRFIFAFALVFLCGCSVDVNIEPATPEPTKEPTSRISLFSYNPQDVVLSFAHDEAAPKTVSDWAADLENELLVANGVYFHEDLSPSGLLIADKTVVSDRTFDHDLSGLIVLEPFQIIDTSVSAMPAQESLSEAAQSYPFLIKNGEAAVSEDSGLAARRTFIGNDEAGTIYLGIVNAQVVTLFELSQELAAMDIAWENVLNLDGGPSSGIVTSTTDDTDFDNFVPVPNVVIVSPR